MLGAHALVGGVDPSPLWRGCTFRGWCIHRRTRANARTLRCMSRRLSDQKCYISNHRCASPKKNYNDDTVLVHLHFNSSFSSCLGEGGKLGRGYVGERCIHLCLLHAASRWRHSRNSGVQTVAPSVRPSLSQDSTQSCLYRT